MRGDREVLIRGSVPATAIKGTTAMALTRGLQVVQVVGFVVTAVELTQATRKSMAARSAAPIAAEGIRQVGGWAMAWGGMKLGGVAGAAVGIETGPGAIVFGAAGALAGGFAGYMGFDWIADRVDRCRPPWVVFPDLAPRELAGYLRQGVTEAYFFQPLAPILERAGWRSACAVPRPLEASPDWREAIEFHFGEDPDRDAAAEVRESEEHLARHRQERALRLARKPWWARLFQSRD